MARRVSARTQRIVELALNNKLPESEDSESDDDVFSRDDLSDDPDYGEVASSECSVSSVEDEPSSATRKRRRTTVDCVEPTGRRETSTEENHSEMAGVEDVPIVEECSSEETGEIFDVNWKIPQGRQKDFDFTISHGVPQEFKEMLVEASPYEVFEKFIDGEIVGLMVEETNRFASQTLESLGQDAKFKWIPTNESEMKNFVGLIGYMGLDKKPSLRSYWSTNTFYKNDVAPACMSRNRFELLLRFWHFSNNEDCPPGDRLYKIAKFIDKLVNNCQRMMTPPQTVCVDESLVKFRGRLVIKQYIPNKAAKYGVKLFKLCASKGYTWNLKPYGGKERDPGGAVPTNVVLQLSEKLLHEGRTIVTDNYYSSIDLANKLLDRKTHLLGTLRANRKGNPKQVITKKLKKGEVIARENDQGIIVLKWKDKRDVLMISTTHDAEMVEIERKNGQKVKKPKMIVDYNHGKTPIDTSDQMASYSTSLRRTVKWYHKVAVEMIFGIALLNAQIIYNSLQEKKKSITDFKEDVVRDLLKKETTSTPLPSTSIPPTVAKRRSLQSHRFDKREGQFNKVRKYCKGCYTKFQEGLTTKNKVKKVVTYCRDCEKEPTYCLECFHNYHRNN